MLAFDWRNWKSQTTPLKSSQKFITKDKILRDNRKLPPFVISETPESKAKTARIKTTNNQRKRVT